ECFYDTKPLEEIGITGKVKNIKLYIQSVQKNRKNIIEREPRFGFYYEFDKLGRARSNFIYDTIELVKENKSVIDKNQKNHVFFSKNGVIEREVRDGGTVTDLYDRNGNLVETVMNNAANTLTGGEDMLYDITEYTYDKNNKILRKTDYWPTRNRDSLKVEAITKNKLDESGNIVEMEVISGPQKLITRYEYDDRNNPVYISNADQSITREYDENNELEKLKIHQRWERRSLNIRIKKSFQKSIPMMAGGIKAWRTLTSVTKKRTGFFVVLM
ncbi:MAG: hypothetical protein H7258_10170, partial [Ferruginibacter sp.]|nr:hypothetical protein [Ferruginibacter sp.]